MQPSFSFVSSYKENLKLVVPSAGIILYVCVNKRLVVYNAKSIETISFPLS